MKNITLIAVITINLLMLSCSNQERTISTEVDNPSGTSEEPKAPKVKYSSSIIIENKDLIIYPLQLNDGQSDSYKRDGGINYWNLAFYNVISGKSELLTREKLIINSFNVSNPDKNPNQSALLTNNFIYYEVTNADFDGDKKLTSADPRTLFLSSLEGKTFVQISPENYSIQNWKLDEKHDLILMDLIKDTNGDKIFDDKDELDYFVYNLKSRAPAKPVFDKAFKNEVKELAKKVL
ncbi:MAG: hypothetical protein EOO96_24460 [Pedobacter sp.]|nr:MAG: hypothetical protein EOO96_24460 [Pedobacter sp.]